MKPSFLQRGALLIVAIVLVAVIAILVSSLSFMAVSNISSSGSNISSAQALYVAEAGLQRALYLRGASGTAICSTLNESGVVVGEGTFAISGISTVTAAATLSAPITSAVTVIPVTSGPAIAGYAAHGRVTINSEEINYARIATTAAGCAPVAAPCLTGARRGMGGTIASAATAIPPTPLSQNQCLLRATGTVNTGRRILEAAIAPQFSDFLDSGAVLVTSGMTITQNTVLPAGDKIILAVVTFMDTVTSDMVIAAGNLRLRRGTNVLASNQNLIRISGSTGPGNNDFPQETQYLLFRDQATTANPSYNIFVTAPTNSGTVTAEVKLIVINVVRNCTNCSQDGGNFNIGVATTLSTFSPTMPAGDNVIIAAVQLDNTIGGGAGNPRIIAANALTLNRTGGPANPLATNAFAIDLARSGRANQGTGFLLLGRDPGAPPNPTYTVLATASSAGIFGEVKIIAFNGLPSARAVGTIAIGTAATSMVTVTTTLAAGENVVIASNQYDNTVTGGAGQRNIAAIATAGGERIVFGGVSQVVSQYPINLCRSDRAECNDFSSGLIWRQANANANQTYSVQALADLAGINGSSQLLVIHVNSPPTLDWQEIYPP